MKKLLTFISVMLACAGSIQLTYGRVALFSDTIEQAETAEGEWLAFIEIPMGASHKYELDESTGLIILDRVMAMPVVYPVNYGMFPQTLAGDGDALDILLISGLPIHPGVLVRVRPIGILRMIDGGEQDDKILAVPSSKVDPTFKDVHCINDIPRSELEKMEAFFRVYKDLPRGRKVVELNGWGKAKEAVQILQQARKNWLMRGD